MAKEKRKVKKHKTKISFWASYCNLEFEDKRLEKFHKELLKVEDKLNNIRTRFLKEFTSPKRTQKESKR